MSDVGEMVDMQMPTDSGGPTGRYETVEMHLLPDEPLGASWLVSGCGWGQTPWDPAVSLLPPLDGAMAVPSRWACVPSVFQVLGTQFRGHTDGAATPWEDWREVRLEPAVWTRDPWLYLALDRHTQVGLGGRRDAPFRGPVAYDWVFIRDCEGSWWPIPPGSEARTGDCADVVVLGQEVWAFTVREGLALGEEAPAAWLAELAAWVALDVEALAYPDLDCDDRDWPTMFATFVHPATGPTHAILDRRVLRRLGCGARQAADRPEAHQLP